jgi:hypothetical protein
MSDKVNLKFSAICNLSAAVVIYGLFGSSFCQADTPTAEELCRQRNSASCEINGLRFFIEDDCPKGARILRPKGTERCELLAENVKAVNTTNTEAAVKDIAQVSDSSAAMPPQQTDSGLFENPFFVVAVIGLLQGLISRAGWGPFIIVALVMPVIVTWATVASAPVNTVGAEYWGYIGLALLKIFASSMLGWGAGLAAHRGLLKLLHK